MLSSPDYLKALQARWDGRVRGTPRDVLATKGFRLSDLTWAVRQLVLQDHSTFMELIWKDKKGRRVKNAEVHKIMGRFLDRAREAGVPALVLAPMGLGKSEQGQAYMLRMLAEDPTLLGGIICDKDDHAAQRVSLIRRYIEQDKDFRRLFPEVALAPTPQTQYVFRLTSNTFAKDESVEGAGILTSGTGTRKSFLFFDDIVTARNAISNPADRPRVIAAYEQTWIGRLVPGSWHYCIATLYHAADLWHRLMERVAQNGNTVYAVLRIGVSDDFKHYDVEESWPGEAKKVYTAPLWEGVWDEAAYRNKYNELVFEGDTSAWFTGYRNIIIDPSNSVFRKEMFDRPEHIRPRNEYPVVVMYADPASSMSDEADNYAGWVIGFDPLLKAGVVLDGWYDRGKPLSDRVDRFLAMYEAWEPSIVAVEGRHEVSFAQRIQEVAAERGLSFRLRKILQNRQKEERIAGLQPLLERGVIRVNGARYPYIVREALAFPKGRHDDALDALEGAWSLLRAWMRARGGVPTSFNLTGQYSGAEPSPVQADGFRYKTPSLPEGSSPTSWTKAKGILFPE